MSKKPNFSSFTPSKLNPKVARQLAEVDKIISKTSDTDKQKLIEQGLSLKPMKMAVITTVNIKKIVTSAFFMRSKVYDSFDDLSTITELDPIKVAITKDKELYILIDGQRRLEHAKSNGEKQVEVQIIGTVVCQSQIAMARGKEMVKFKKPLTPLELAHGLMQLKDQIICDFGENAFFSHGGDRKTNHKTKQSLQGYIAEVLGLNAFKVDTLLRFGSNVGPMGLAGLLTKDDMVGMPLRQINQINASLKNADISKQIENRANELNDDGASQDDLIDGAGELASKTISQALKEHAWEDNDNDNDDDNAEEIDSSDLPATPKWPNSKKDDNDDESEDTKPGRKKVKPAKIVKIISDIQIELKKMKKDFEDCKRIDDIDQAVVEAKWKRLGDHWGKLCVGLGEAGLY